MKVDSTPTTLRWQGDLAGQLILIDQTKLPEELVELPCENVQSVWEAIRSLRVRGAPAIGIAAAYGVCLGLQDDAAGVDRLVTIGQDAAAYLATSRPTAVNLFWALDRIRNRLHVSAQAGHSALELRAAVLQEARAIHDDDRAMCHAIGRAGADLIQSGDNVLTHCNAGGLATAEYGTALSVVFTAQDQGKTLHVWVDETRPLLQGARLTAWELKQRDLPATLICDSTAAQVMREGRVQIVITGADRIAANGDAANKIGTYGLAVLAKAHGIPFYIAAPSSTFDLSLPSGSEIPIELRSPEEICEGFGRRTAPVDMPVYNPAFDVTPAEYIAGLITERGLIRPVTREVIAERLPA